MTAVRYWVLIHDMVWDSNPEWPDGLRVVEPGPYETPGVRWWLFEDDGAPASLNHMRVELTFVRSGGKTMIGSREPAV